MSLREQGKDARRTKIVDTARQLIMETGQAGLSMRALADKAGVSLATPYNLFGSKNAILMRILDDDVQRFSSSMEAVKSRNEIDRIFDTIALARRFYEAEPDFYRAILSEVYYSAGEVHDAFSEPRSELWKDLVIRAQKAGFIDAARDGNVLRQGLQHVFSAVLMKWVSGWATLEEFQAHVSYGFAVMLLGVATKEGKANVEPRVRKLETVLVRLNKAAAAAQAETAAT